MVEMAQASPAKLLFEARRHGLSLSLDGEKIRMSRDAAIEAGTQTEAYAERLRANAEPIRELLRRRRDSDETVVAMFAEAAGSTPDAVAVVAGADSLTYRELDRRSAALAGALAAAGCGPEWRVGLLRDRSLDWVVALLGIMRAGCVYVPLAAATPDQIGEMCRTGLVQFLIGDPGSIDELPPFETMLTPKLDIGAATEVMPANPAPLPRPDQLAYIITTSGSTGRPKAVMIEHRALANLVRWHVSEYASDAPDCRATQVAATSFDAHLWEIFPYLCAGATLFLVDRDVLLDAAALSRFLRDQAITHCFLPTPVAETFLKHTTPEMRPASLRHLLVGGDVLRRVPVFDGFDLVNHYGPTEAAVVATAGYCAPGDENPPIGFAVAGLAPRILADSGPVEMPLATGELGLVGTSLARGYFGDPAATALAFVPDPHGNGSRLYRTGDQVLLRPDGQLAFIGRNDLQLKVRGVRIEPATVESCLLGDAAVVDAALVKHGETDSLIAYVVLNERARSDETRIWRDDVADWQRLYEATYAGLGDSAEAEFLGWNSSLTGSALPASDMRAWADEICGRIRSLNGRNILEVGVGSGILLFRLLADCASYTACDISPRAIAHVESRLSRLPAGDRPKVALFRAAADELGHLAAGQFDVIILNSVIQYFPDGRYLATVLDGLANLLAPGGSLFIGDVRDARLERAFAALVATHRADGAPRAEAATDIYARCLDEQDELLVHPDFFTEWASRRGDFARADALARTGNYDRELSTYRFDALLTRAGAATTLPGPVIEWSRECLEDLTAEIGPAHAFTVTAIPRAGALADSAAAARLDAALAAGGARDPLLPADEAEGIRPDDLLSRLALDGWLARATLNGQAPRCFAVQARRNGADWPAPLRDQPVSALTTDPALRRARRRTTDRLRQKLRDALPAYMVPDQLALLDAMPLTESGKTDRRALAARPLPGRTGRYEPPRTPLEELIAIWFADALALDRVGREDNLFDLGGNSLTAARIAARFNAETGLELPLRLILESRSVAALADDLTEALGGAGPAAEIAAILREEATA